MEKIIRAVCPKILFLRESEFGIFDAANSKLEREPKIANSVSVIAQANGILSELVSGTIR